MATDTLSSCVQRLLESLKQNGPLPEHDEVRVLEVSARNPTDGRGRLNVDRRSFMTLANYEPRFQELLSVGLRWLNVSCYGILDRVLVVAVELPAASDQKSPHTSVNYSGPPLIVLRNGWDARKLLNVE